MKDDIPRLALDQLDAGLAATLMPIVERLGYFGEFFQVVGHVPDGLHAFMEYTKAVKAPLPDNVNELLALTVCTALDADYERIQHERLAQKLGFSRSWIAAAEGRNDVAPAGAGESSAALTLGDDDRNAVVSTGAGHALKAKLSAQLSEQESLLRSFALSVIANHGRGTSEAVARVNAALGPERTVAALLQITRFMMIATLCNALQLELPVRSVFETA